MKDLALSDESELQAEQAHIVEAYRCLEAARTRALDLTSMVEVGKGGTNQARYERDVILESVANRLGQLEIGDATLVFGRIDLSEEAGGDIFHVGRTGVWNEAQDPIVIDWRAPAAEPFYRATASDSMGIDRRRHFSTRGKELLAIEDEFFGDLERLDEATDRRVSGEGALVAALEASRTGKLSDIVATIQGEQDEVIRSELPGILVVQGGPGTGKTVVALHRAAYLLYTHRFPLEGQGVLVIGPNRLFLSYIEQVLPSLGEAGVFLSTIADLPEGVNVRRRDTEPVARIKGDLKMVRFIDRAVKTRQRQLREDLRIGVGLQTLRLDVERSAYIVAEARRRFRTHNAARRFVESEVMQALHATSREDADLSLDELQERLHGNEQVREALEWMWPVLTPAQLLFDLFGSKALLRAAGGSSLTEDEVDLLHIPRTGSASDVVWSTADAPLLDEARAVLGARRKKKKRPRGEADPDEVRTYGHIVVDEAQDLSPMDLRVLDRRSLNGSMTLVGDIAQATGAWANQSWRGVLEHLPDKIAPRRAELTIGYRIPGPTMSLAATVLTHAAPGLKPPRAVREDGDPPEVYQVAELTQGVIDRVRYEVETLGTGNIAVIVPVSLVATMHEALGAADIDHGDATRGGLAHQVTVVPVSLVKGLEVDASIVVEPALIVSEERHGVRSLYVSLTRSTKRVTVVHSAPLPEALVMAAPPPPDPEQLSLL